MDYMDKLNGIEDENSVVVFTIRELQEIRRIIEGKESIRITTNSYSAWAETIIINPNMNDEYKIEQLKKIEKRKDELEAQSIVLNNKVNDLQSIMRDAEKKKEVYKKVIGNFYRKVK